MGARVTAYDAAAGCTQFQVGQRAAFISQENATAADGSFRLTNVPAGQFWLYTQRTNEGFAYYAGPTRKNEAASCPADFTAIPVATDDVTGIRFVFNPR